MSEKLRLPTNKTFSVSVGPNDRFSKAWEGEARSFDQDMIKRTFPTAHTRVLLERDVNPGKIHDTISTFAEQSVEQDTLFFFFSGHGLPDSLTLPVGEDKIAYPKEDLFKELSAFPGRKIAILSCCHGAYPHIPNNTLLLTPSHQDTPAYGHAFFVQLLFEFSDAKTNPHALTYLVEKFLTSYHNRPYGPLEGNMWEQDPDRPDLQIYEEEKQLGRELLINYQRAFVLSSLIANGTILTVDQKCFFTGK